MQPTVSLVPLALLVAAPAAAQAAPSPYEVVSQLDLECRRAEGLPPQPNLPIRQLNPVLQGSLPNTIAALGPLEEVCVPVAKNLQYPTAPASQLIRWIDLACYEAAADPVAVTVELSHLDPVLAGTLPDEEVTLVELEQVCVPVRKAGGDAPAAIENFARYFDFACYGLAEPTSEAQTRLRLTHLNPVIRALGLEDRRVEMQKAQQLCVPIAKGQQVVPPPVLDVLEWADFLKYDLRLPEDPPPLSLNLTHLNPRFEGSQPFDVVLEAPVRLMVPVAKDGTLPPD